MAKANDQRDSLNRKSLIKQHRNYHLCRKENEDKKDVDTANNEKFNEGFKPMLSIYLQKGYISVNRNQNNTTVGNDVLKRAFF